MVRAEEHSCRSRLLDIARKGDTRCLRLFLDYHGLALLWSWMMDNTSPNKLKIQILDTLFALPIQNKTMLKDSKVMCIVEKWTKPRGDVMSINDRKDRFATIPFINSLFKLLI
ncbi:hypothetical protein AAG570_002012 [Ranatra chinensis]|uniref:Uncharacterized protein n=1 Tax=Ranatra chinensis TaxID=642074 RepID=A0ABD0YM14_9HEMI